MTVLYKYLLSKDLAKVISGSIRIGTLLGYQNEEEHGTECGDRKEGLRTVHHIVNYAHSDEPETITPVIERFIHGFRDSKNCTIRNGLIIETEVVSNVYTFCCSSEFNQDTMRRMGYDACVRISRPDLFFHYLTRKLHGKGLITGHISHGNCRYDDRKLTVIPLPQWYRSASDALRAEYDEMMQSAPTPEKIPPWAHKEIRYDYQKEYRYVWLPTNLPIEPIIIRSLSIRELLSVHYAPSTEPA